MMVYYSIKDYKYWFVGKVKTFLWPTVKQLFASLFNSTIQILRLAVFPIWALTEFLFCLYTVLVRRKAGR